MLAAAPQRTSTNNDYFPINGNLTHNLISIKYTLQQLYTTNGRAIEIIRESRTKVKGEYSHRCSKASNDASMLKFLCSFILTHMMLATKNSIQKCAHSKGCKDYLALKIWM